LKPEPSLDGLEEPTVVVEPGMRPAAE